MAQRGCATPRIADELVLVPPRGSPHRKSTCPRCENVLAPFATRRCSYTCEAGNVEHQLDERIRPDHEAPACTRALPHRQKKSPGCEQPGDCLEHGSISCGFSPGGSGSVPVPAAATGRRTCSRGT